MEKWLENEFAKLKILTYGAEWKELYWKPWNRNLLWEGKEEVWPFSAPLCFPWCSRIDDGYFLEDNQKFPAKIHGFIAEQNFETVCQQEDSVTLRTTWKQDSRVWPWSFCFEMRYSLKGPEIVSEWSITNLSRNPMPVQFGFHTGFQCPFLPDTRLEDYVFRFQKTEPSVGSGVIRITRSMFDHGRIAFGGLQSDWVEVLETQSGRSVRVSIKGYPYLQLWSKPQIPGFVCVEPWTGVYGPGHDLFERPGTVPVKSGARLHAFHRVQVCEHTLCDGGNYVKYND